MKKAVCPKCRSGNVKIIGYLGIKCIVCKNCGFDQARDYEVYPEAKASQKAKSRHSPYKAGGHRRALK